MIIGARAVLALLLLIVTSVYLPAQQQVQVQWATYLGGGGRDEARDVDCDNNENAYVCGVFESTDFPVPRGVSGPQDTAGPGYLAKFSPEGELLWLMWFQGFSPHEVAVSANGLAVVVGSADVGANTLGGTQLGTRGTTDVGVVLVGPNGERLASMTLGGTRDDIGTSIDIINDRIYVAGITASTDLPTTAGAPQRLYGGGGSLGQGIGDGIVAKYIIDQTGGTARLVPDVVTYFGGRYLDEILCIRRQNTLGEVYIAGRTRSDNLPGSPYISTGRLGDVFNDDGFMARLDSNLRPVWHMYMGGTGNDVVYTVQPRVEYDPTLFTSAVSVTACGVYNGGPFINPMRNVPSPVNPPYAGGSQFGGDAFALQTSGFQNNVRWVQSISTINDDICVALPRNQSLFGLPLVFSNGPVGPFAGTNGMNAYLWTIDFGFGRDLAEQYQGNADECILDADQQRFGFGGRALRLGSQGEYFCGSTNSTLLPETNVPGKSFQTSNRGGISDGYLVRTGCSSKRLRLVASDSVLCSSDDTTVVTFMEPTATVVWPDGSQGQSYTVSGPGLIRVRYTIQGGCNEITDSVEIKRGNGPSGRLEPQGTIRLCDTVGVVLTIRDGSNIERVAWSNGVIGQDTTLRVTTPGRYSATLFSSDGCTVNTDTVTVVSSSSNGSTQLLLSYAGPDSADAGSTIEVVLRISVPDGTALDSLPTEWSAIARFDKTMLLPLRPLGVGTTDDTLRSVRLSGRRALQSDTLGTFKLAVALGERDSTDIIIDSLVLDPCYPESNSVALPFRTAGICRLDSVGRFITTRQPLLRTSVISNPVGSDGAVGIATGGDLTRATARIVTLLGEEIMLTTIDNTGRSISWSIPPSLPSGRFLFVVQTGSAVASSTFEVVR